MAALGQRTQRIPFGTGVTCPTYRYHPAVVAQAFASLGVFYPGRIFLGVGTGEALNEHITGEWGEYEERADRMIEAVQVICRLWTGEWVDHKGEYYTVPQARIYDVPQQPVPIYIAAEGPKAMHKAGRYGDGLISDSKTILQPEMRQSFEEGARAAGKDPSTMPLLAEHFVVVGDRAEAEKAATIWRFLPKAWDPYVNVSDPREIERRAEQDVSLDEVMGMWTVSEDPDAHAQALHKLIDGGVTQIYVHAGNFDQIKAIEFYRTEVLPRVKGERTRTR